MDSEVKNIVTERPLSPSDFNFVFGTFKQGAYHSNDWFKSIPLDIYMRCYGPVIEQLVERSIESKVLVLKDDPDHIVGFSILEGSVLHWVYIKPIYRGFKLSRELVPESVKVITHISKRLKRKKLKYIFNPFLI